MSKETVEYLKHIRDESLYIRSIKQSPNWLQLLSVRGTKQNKRSFSTSFYFSDKIYLKQLLTSLHFSTGTFHFGDSKSPIRFQTVVSNVPLSKSSSQTQLPLSGFVPSFLFLNIYIYSHH